MTSGFNFHLSCTPKWSNVFETNTAGQQSFCERLFLGATFTNGTNASAGKGLKGRTGHNMALHDWPISQGILTFYFSIFPVHLTSFPLILFQFKVTQAMNI